MSASRGGDVPVDGDGGLPVRVDRRTALPRTCRSYLSAGSPVRGASQARSDVVSDGDRRRRALRVEQGTGGDVDVAGDVDHGTGHDVAHTRNRDAGVVPRRDAGEGRRGGITGPMTTAAGVVVAGGSARDTCSRHRRQRHHHHRAERDTKPHTCSLRRLCHEKEAQTRGRLCSDRIELRLPLPLNH